MIRIIDNIFPDQYASDLYKLATHIDFPLYYTSETVTGKDWSEYGYSIKDSQQFTHLFHRNGDATSDWSYMMTPAYAMIGDYLGTTVTDYIRTKVNLITKESDYPDGYCNGIHVDELVAPNEHKYTMVYYPADSDGDTIIFKQKHGDKTDNLTVDIKVEPKYNRGVLFDSSRYHASTPPRKTSHRVVYNFVFSTLIDLEKYLEAQGK